MAKKEIKESKDNNQDIKANQTQQQKNNDNLGEQSNKSSILEPQVIGQLPVEKQKSSFWLFIFFGILIGVVFGLPYINDYIESKTAVKEDDNTNIEDQPNSESNLEDVEDVIYREIDKNTIFNVETLRFNEISKEFTDDYYLNMNVTNNANETFDFDNSNYFVELYTADKTLLERVKLTNSENIASGQTVNVKLLISENSYNNATLLTVSLKEETDYPEVELTKSLDDKKMLACTSQNNTITYYFDSNNELIEITDILNYPLETGKENEYAEAINQYTNNVASLNNIEGVSSSLAQSDYSFTVNTQIDLETVNFSKLDNKYYFAKGTLPKVVVFEMESMRYSCE